MRLTTKENILLDEPLVLVEYAEMDEEARSILFALNSIGKELLGKRFTANPWTDAPSSTLRAK